MLLFDNMSINNPPLYEANKDCTTGTSTTPAEDRDSACPSTNNTTPAEEGDTLISEEEHLESIYQICIQIEKEIHGMFPYTTDSKGYGNKARTLFVNLRRNETLREELIAGVYSIGGCVYVEVIVYVCTYAFRYFDS